jgi:hypothetical protein
MHYPVIIQPTPEGRYLAFPFNLPECRAEAATKEEAVTKLRATLVSPVPPWEVVDVEVPPESPIAQLVRPRMPQDVLDRLDRELAKMVFRSIRDSETAEASPAPQVPYPEEEASESEEDRAWEELETLSAQVQEQLEREGITAEQVLAELPAIRRELFIEKYGKALLEEWEAPGVSQP